MPFRDVTTPEYGRVSVYEPCWEINKPDVWSFDCTLAGFIADGLETLAKLRNTVPSDYWRHIPSDVDDVDAWELELRTNAAIFRAYATRYGPWRAEYEAGWFDAEAGSLQAIEAVEADLKSALAWLHKRFTDLWD
jgi:hypothetical protein